MQELTWELAESGDGEVAYGDGRPRGWAAPCAATEFVAGVYLPSGETYELGLYNAMLVAKGVVEEVLEVR